MIQRIFIGDKQRYKEVDVGPSTNAEDVIESVRRQGGLELPMGSGDWMLWEDARDFTMGYLLRLLHYT